MSSITQRLWPWQFLIALGLHQNTAWAQTEAPPSNAVEPARQHVSMPRLLAPLEPEYPAQGTSDARVVLAVTLDRAGSVTQVEVSAGDEPYASAAVRAAQRAAFTPALRNGEPVAAKITIAVDFTYSAAETLEPSVPPPATPAPQSAPSAGDPNRVEAPIDIVVRAPRQDDLERTIHRAEARLTAGTFGDPLRAVELLPGITPLISGVPYFFVRGAPAGSVNFYIDEARIPQLYHVGPGSSVMHPQFVEGVALRSGPYRARYGDATSGVVTTRVVADVAGPSAEVEARTFESGAFVGTPLNEGRASLAVAGKVSHLEPILELINPELRLSYWDYQALATYRLSARDQLSLLVFGAGDYVAEEELGGVDINIDTRFHRLKLGYNRNLSTGIDLHNYLIFGTEQTRFDAQDELFRDRSLGAGSSLSVVVDDHWEWALGASGEAVDYDASGASAFFGDPNNAAVSRVDTHAALWGEGRWSPSELVHLDLGLRAAGYSSDEAVSLALEPRLTSSLELSRRLETTLAIGYATQTPSAAVPAPGVRPAELRGGLQEALQRAWTLEYRIPHQLNAEATLFYNDYFALSDPLSLTTVPDPLEVGDTDTGGEPPSEPLNFVDRPSGRSYGLEVLLRRPFTQALSGSVAYTLSRSTRRLGDSDVPSSFDRTHLFNASAGYKLGLGYHVSTRLMLYSGLPVRQFGVIGGRTGVRSDGYFRLDLRVSKEWQLSWGDLMLIVEMLNATFEEEVLGVSCFPGRCVTATFGPVTVPSVGLRGTFGGARATQSRAQLD